MIGRNRFANLIAQTGLFALSRRILARRGRFALNFHGVSSRRYPDIPRNLQPHHTTAEFRLVLTWLASRFKFLTVEEFLHTAKPGILLTFDDGHANNLNNILPILTEYRVQGLFFVSTQHVYNPQDWLSFTRRNARHGWEDESSVPDDFARDCCDGLSENQLAELAVSPWAIIGAHTVSHPSLPACPLEKVHAELVESRLHLQQVSAQEVGCFAYPYGDYNRTVAEAARQAGFLTAFVVDPIPVGLPAYEIPRVGIYDCDPRYLSAKLSGLHRPALRGPAMQWSLRR